MRVFYCPTHGRVTDEPLKAAVDAQYAEGSTDDERLDAFDAEVDWLCGIDACTHCSTWFYGLRRKSAKRAGES